MHLVFSPFEVALFRGGVNVQTWHMLAGMLEKREVIGHLFGEHTATVAERDRCPSPTDWQVAEALVGELHAPHQLAVKAQEKGYWLLPDALHRMACLHTHLNSSATNEMEGVASGAAATVVSEPTE
jgi:hypothetical protein